MTRAGRQFEQLLRVMAKLRGAHGCPWDREQTHASLLASFREELCEFIDAVEENDTAAMQEELGDLFLHLVFQAQIAREQKTFTVADALEGIVEKLIRRHPHVFGTTKVRHARDVLDNWEQIKKKEKGGHARPSALDGVPRSLSALSAAHTLQKKARRAGFDWRHVDQVLAKVDEELGELRAAMRSRNRRAVAAEMGDLLFSIVNVSRFVDVEPEQALRGTIRKFNQRFRAVEQRVHARGVRMNDLSLEELDALWNKVKRAERRPRKRHPRTDAKTGNS